MDNSLQSADLQIPADLTPQAIRPLSAHLGLRCSYRLGGQENEPLTHAHEIKHTEVDISANVNVDIVRDQTTRQVRLRSIFNVLADYKPRLRPLNLLLWRDLLRS